MTFISAVRTCFRKYAIGGGRATRSEYWYFFLFTVLFAVVVGLIEAAVFGPVSEEVDTATTIVFWLVLMLPTVAVQIRRLHDLDKSWRWGLLALIPVLGTIALLIMSAQRGTAGTNRFGPDPLDGSADLAGHATAH